LRGSDDPAIDLESVPATTSLWESMAARMSSLEERNPDYRTADDAADHVFRFLNTERRLTHIDWSTEYVGPLWTYHLSYFDYAVDLARAWRDSDEQRYGDCYVHLWTGWLDAAERGAARIEPYPTSVRCLNALRSLWMVHDRLPSPFTDRLLAAVHAQLEWLAANVERHLRANHLQRNLTALARGSITFDSPEARRWRPFIDELWKELEEQVLSDGGHFERSPMYHAAALDDFLRTVALCEVAGIAVPADVRPCLASMTRAFQWLSRPDGTLHLFNDAANGERPGRGEVLDLARRVLREDFVEPAGVFALPDTGYYGVVDPASGTRLVVDAGPPGPVYQPGHAHCDMLSFELDLAGRPVVVDAGVHGYDGDAYREYVRSTRAHNTVAIAGRDQHELWATFRVARRGEILAATCHETNGQFEFEGACRHYHDKRAVHRRTVRMRGDELTVTDTVEGAVGRVLSSRLHLHPGFRVEPLDAGFLALSEYAGAMLRVRIEPFGAVDAFVRRGERNPLQGWWCPEFGVALPAATIESTVPANDGRRFGWRIWKV
jgi:uncharacterized heparinase superfamily protein